MGKTRLEKIESYEEQIAQIRNLQKMERQKYSNEERAARTRRLCSRHGLLEKMLPEIITITDEQYQTFLEKAVANAYGRDILNKIIAQTATTVSGISTKTATQASKTNSAEVPQIGFGDDEDSGE
ncbi:MAG: DUF3847 domain-containing protein [Oscillospiraceae bacterium]|nr:DUF3847 domain-containing protein [Oscillospiraceae bacterium]